MPAGLVPWVAPGVVIACVASYIGWRMRTRASHAADASLRLAVSMSRGPSGPGSGHRRSGRQPGAEPGGMLHFLARTALLLTPPAETARTARRLAAGGLDRPVASERFLAARGSSVALVPAMVVAVVVSPWPRLVKFMTLLGAGAMALLGPEAWLSRRIDARREAVRRELPTLVELLLISVEAGLGLDQALMRVLPSLPGALGNEISRYLAEVRMGASRREALDMLERRTDVPEVRSFVRVLSQSESLGVPVGQMLRSQAGEARNAQMQRAREQAAKAPVKMLFPLVFCVLPALFVVVLGPAGIEVFNMLSKA